MTQKLNLPAWNSLHKKAKEAITMFYNDLLNHEVVPNKMTIPIGSYLVGATEFEFRVVAEIKDGQLDKYTTQPEERPDGKGYYYPSNAKLNVKKDTE